MKRVLAVLAPLVFVAACDLFGPSGSGALAARVEAPGADVGAAVVRIEGEGVRGIRALGSTRLFERPLEEPGSYRVVAVNPDGASVEFGIEVDDVGGELPSATVEMAAGTDDRTLAGDLVVRVSR